MRRSSDSRLLAVAVLFIFALVFSLSSAAQVMQPVDPNAASSASVEDLSSASLADSHLHADPPIVLEKAENKDFIREFIAVQWRPGDRIYLYVIRPAAAFA